MISSRNAVAIALGDRFQVGLRAGLFLKQLQIELAVADRQAVGPDPPLHAADLRVVLDPLADDFALVDNLSTMGFAPLVAMLVGAAVLVSALGSGITLRRFLKV